MKVINHGPAQRGVTSLMYVGDDDAVEKAVAPSPAAQLAGIVAAVVALQSHGVTRLAAAAVAGVIGYRSYKAT